jgi:hypothetical protein
MIRRTPLTAGKKHAARGGRIVLTPGTWPSTIPALPAGTVGLHLITVDDARIRIESNMESGK